MVACWPDIALRFHGPGFPVRPWALLEPDAFQAPGFFLPTLLNSELTACLRARLGNGGINRAVRVSNWLFGTP